MKKVLKYGFAAVAALLLSFSLSAQDINEVIDLFNKANQEFKAKKYDEAKASVTKTYDLLTTLGDVEGEEASILKGNCEKLLQAIPYMQGKDLLAAKKYDEALVKLQEARAASEKFSNKEVVTELNELIPQVGWAKAADFFAADDFKNAAAAYEEVVKDNTDNAEAYVHLAYTYDKLGDQAKAIASYEKGIAAATKVKDAESLDMAKTQLANIYLAKAVEAQKAKSWGEVVANAAKSLEVKETAQAALLTGIGSFEQKKYDAVIPALEKAVKLENNTETLQKIAYYLAVSYEVKGSKADACRNYKKIVDNPQFKAYAESKIKTLGCN